MNMASMNIEVLICGPLQTNTVIISAENSSQCWVIDPAEPLFELLEYLNSHNLNVEGIIVTHGHGDHISGVSELTKVFPKTQFLAPKEDKHMLSDAVANLSSPFGFTVTAPEPDRDLLGGEKIEIAGNSWQVLDTSGHSPGGISLYCENAGICLCGDALFAGGIGRTDFPGADHNLLIKNIREKLLTLDEQTILVPGHGPATSVAAEIQSNPFVK